MEKYIYFCSNNIGDANKNDEELTVSFGIQNGAAAAIVSRIPDGVCDKTPLLIVQDVTSALNGLAAFARKRCQAKQIKPVPKAKRVKWAKAAKGAKRAVLVRFEGTRRDSAKRSEVGGAERLHL